MDSCDLIIRGADVIDGTGAPGTDSDVAISDGLIVGIGDLADTACRQVIDATGKVLCPGFVDVHSHSDFTILVNPAAESKIRQGVTTEVNGQCGFSPFPVKPGVEELVDALCPFITARPDWTWSSTAEYLATLEAARPNINVAQMAGHSGLRAWGMGFENRPATAGEIEAISAAGQDALDQGAVGIAVGLGYPLGSFAATGEIDAVAAVAARNDALVTVHLRDEGAQLYESIEEMVDVAKRASDQGALRLQIVHLKAAGERWWGKVGRAIEIIEAARDEGIDVAFDVYPYIAGSRHLSGSLPAWVHDGGNEALMRRLKDPTCRDRLHRGYEAWLDGEESESVFALDAERTVVTSVATDGNRWVEGKSLTEIARTRGQDPVDATFDLLIEEGGHASIVLFAMNERDMNTCLAHPLGSVGTDGLAFAPYGPLSRGKPHPRSYGTFPRAIGRYARDQGIMTVVEAIRKCTSLPASRLGLNDRGIIREGMRADLTVFDPTTLMDTATFEDPHQYPTGIHWVIVNGQVAIENGVNHNPGAGHVLRRR